jgi:hypothetical protein
MEFVNKKWHNINEEAAYNEILRHMYYQKSGY